MVMVEWGKVLKTTLCFFRNAVFSIGKIFIIEFFQNVIFFTDRFCEYVMNYRVLLNISTVIGKLFRRFVFNFNLTGFEQPDMTINGRRRRL